MSKRLRQAVRGLVVDHGDHVLMVRLVFPHGSWWVLPGGGIDPGEDHVSALHRELREEVGLRDPVIGSLLWTRVHEFPMVSTDGESFDGQSESVYLVRTPRFEIAPSMSPDELRSENLFEHRWWTVDELSGYTGRDNFSPPTIDVHTRDIILNGPPSTPFHIHQSG